MTLFLLSLMLLLALLPSWAQKPSASLSVTSERHKKYKWNDARYNFHLRNAAGQVVATYEDLLFLEPFPGTTLFIMGRGHDRKNFTYRQADELGLIDAYTGREVVPCGENQIEVLSRCAIRVRTKDKKYRLLSSAGAPLHTTPLDYVDGGASNGAARTYFGFRVEGLYGLVDSCGVVRLPARYNYPINWNGRSARVRLGDKWTLLDSALRETGPPRFSFISYNLGQVYAYSTTATMDPYDKPKGGKVGLMNERGEFLTDEIFEDFTAAEDGLKFKRNGLWVTLDLRSLSSGGDLAVKAALPEVYREFHKKAQFGDYKYGYRLGSETLVKPKYDIAYTFLEGYAVVGKKGKDKVMTIGGNEAWAMEYGLVNTKGEEVIPVRYKALWPYADSLYGFGEGGDWESSYRYGILDVSGKVRVPAEFKRLGELREGLIPAMKITHYGYVDLGGRLVLPYEYRHASPFVNGVACVANADYSWYWIDKRGKELLPGRRFTSITDWDSTGRAWAWNKMDRWGRPDSALLITRTGEVVGRRPLNGPPAPPPANSRRCSRCRGSGFAYKARDVEGSFTWREGMFQPVETRTTYSYSYKVYEKDGACPQCGGDGWE